MGFMDAYKRLEKLCGDVMDDSRRVTAYIDEMTSTPRGEYYVQTWNEDLRKLKHYRWVRNQIAHEEGCTELNMCTAEDERWINDFYTRMMQQNDPLALYYRAKRENGKVKSQSKTPVRTANDQRTGKRTDRIAVLLFAVLAVAVFVWFRMVS